MRKNKKNAKTAAQHAKDIHNKWYSKRKPGEDQLSDDGYNKDMEALVQATESKKAELGIPSAVGEQQQQQMPPHPQQQQMMAENGQQQQMMDDTGMQLPKAFNGGGLPKFDGTGSTSFIRPITRTDNVKNPYYELNKVNSQALPFSNSPYGEVQNIGMEPEQIKMDEADYAASSYGTGLDFNKTRETSVINRDAMHGDIGGEEGVSESPFSPGASMIGPVTSIAGNIGSSIIQSIGAKKTYQKLMDGLRRRKVDPNKADFSGERTNIDSNRAMNSAAAREQAKKLGNSFAATQLANLSRVQGDRLAGKLKSASYSKETQLNQAAEDRADAINNRNNQLYDQQKMAIETGYGNKNPEIAANLVQSTAANVNNYLDTNRKMQSDQDYLNMISDNYKIDYQGWFNGLSDKDKRRARLGLLNPQANKTLRA